MNEQTSKIDRRLSRIEGQIRGVRRMLSEGAYCSDIISQVNAARSALSQVGAQLVVRHVETCIVGHEEGTAHEEAKKMTHGELVEELEETLSRLVRG